MQNRHLNPSQFSSIRFLQVSVNLVMVSFDLQEMYKRKNRMIQSKNQVVTRGVQEDSIRFSIRYWPSSNVEYSISEVRPSNFE